MTEYNFSMIKENNPYKEKCEEVEEKLNKRDFYKSTVIMAISLEKLTNDLIKNTPIKIHDGKYLKQSERIIILKNNKIITYQLSNDFHSANNLRNSILHGDENGNPYDDDKVYYFTSLLKNHFLKIMVWYDENYVSEKINPIFKLKQYLNKECDDSPIINIIEREIDDGKITENRQITKRIKEELINYVESLNIELEIKEKIRKGISSGIIKNKSQIEEKIKGQKKDPRIGVANIINTENMMKYTIQSTDIDKELKENMEKLENNQHENKQLQEDYNKYGIQSFTTETVTICKNEQQSQMVKEDEIIFNANKSYNNNVKVNTEEEELDDKLPEPEKEEPVEEEITANENKLHSPDNQSNNISNRIKKLFKR